MILTHRKFDREPPSKEAKCIYIFCEGVKRENQYFRYFIEMDSRIKLEIYPLNPSENNSPLGLLEIAKKCTIVSESNLIPKYTLQENDEVWIVFDKDKDKNNSREIQIQQIYTECEQTKNWFVAQSNPCFEVWLYYHCKSTKPNSTDEKFQDCKEWKKLVNDSISGGFDSKRHPIFIEKATQHSETNFEKLENRDIGIGSTEVFHLSKKIIPLIKSKLDKVLAEFKDEN